MAVRKKPARPPKGVKCPPGEFEYQGKCYKIFLVGAMGGIVRGANCNFAKTNIVIDVSEQWKKAGAAARKKKKPASKKKK